MELAARTAAWSPSGGLDTSHMTLLTVNSIPSYMDFGIYQANLATGSTGCTIYWDVESDQSVKTEVVGNISEASHTYSTEGRHVIAISDDIKDLYLVSGASASNPYVIRLSKVLVGLRTGDKVTSFPSSASSSRPDGIYAPSVIETYDLNNVTGSVRPFYGLAQVKANTVCRTIICNHVTTINSYGFERADAIEDVYCNSVTVINNTASIRTRDAYPARLHFDGTCAEIKARSDIFNSTMKKLIYMCSDGKIVWDGSEWVIEYDASSAPSQLGGGGINA